MIVQEPKVKGNYLYNNRWDEQTLFSQKVYLPHEDTPKWAECTPERRQEWIDEYQPEPEPETPENENKEDVQ